ncbi:MAG: SHOCT domain-containing protein [Burkholderiales bacterium]
MATKLSVILGLIFFVLCHPLIALAQQSSAPISPQQPPWDWPGPWHMWHGGWGFWWIFPMMMLFFCVLAIFFIGRRFGGGGSHHWGPPWHMMDRSGRPWSDPAYSALQVLNERFAKGEIEKQEYEEKKAAILSSGPH